MQKPVDNSSLSIGTIVGIAVGSVAVVLLGVAVIVLLIKSCSGKGNAKGAVTPIGQPSTPETSMHNFKRPLYDTV